MSVTRISMRQEAKIGKHALNIFLMDVFFILAFVFFYVSIGNSLVHSDNGNIPNVTGPSNWNPEKFRQVYPYFWTSEAVKAILMISNMIVVAYIDDASQKSVKRARLAIKVLMIVRVLAGQLDYLIIIFGNIKIIGVVSIQFIAFGSLLVLFEVVCSFGSIHVAKKIIAEFDEFLLENGETVELISMEGRMPLYNENC